MVSALFALSRVVLACAWLVRALSKTYGVRMVRSAVF
ncbi:hypothetical protein VIF_001603 [Vibrio cholerae TM 11079-80]|nr:hypothetical protein VIF_001603 [Vibrio cholerae TM 11079-80]